MKETDIVTMTVAEYEAMKGKAELTEWKTTADYKGGYGEMFTSKCGRYAKGFEYRDNCTHFFMIDFYAGVKVGGVTAEIIAASRIRK